MQINYTYPVVRNKRYVLGRNNNACGSLEIPSNLDILAIQLKYIYPLLKYSFASSSDRKISPSVEETLVKVSFFKVTETYCV